MGGVASFFPGLVAACIFRHASQETAGAVGPRSRRNAHDRSGALRAKRSEVGPWPVPVGFPSASDGLRPRKDVAEQSVGHPEAAPERANEAQHSKQAIAWLA